MFKKYLSLLWESHNGTQFESPKVKPIKIHEIITLLFPLLLTSTCLHGKTSFPFHLFIWILAFYKYRQGKFEYIASGTGLHRTSIQDDEDVDVLRSPDLDIDLSMNNISNEKSETEICGKSKCSSEI